MSVLKALKKQAGKPFLKVDTAAPKEKAPEVVQEQLPDDLKGFDIYHYKTGGKSNNLNMSFKQGGAPVKEPPIVYVPAPVAPKPKPKVDIDQHVDQHRVTRYRPEPMDIPQTMKNYIDRQIDRLLKAITSMPAPTITAPQPIVVQAPCPPEKLRKHRIRVTERDGEGNIAVIEAQEY